MFEDASETFLAAETARVQDDDGAGGVPEMLSEETEHNIFG